MPDTFKGFSAMQKRASEQAARQRAEVRARAGLGDVRTRDRTVSKDPYKDLSQYGKLFGTSKQERSDGSVVYFRDGRVVAEFNPQGKRVVRVGVSKDVSKVGRIEKITAPVMIQQRYKEALSKYNRELSRLERERKAEQKRQILRKAVLTSSFTGVSAQNLLSRTAALKLKGPYSEDYKKRLVAELDLRLASELQTVKNLHKRMEQARTGNIALRLSAKELKQLKKIQTKVSRVESERVKLSKRQEETIKKITGKSIIKGEGYLARAARQLPAQAFSTFYNLAPALYKSVLEVDAFFALVSASPKVIDKSKFRQGAVDNFRKTGNAILEAYDPRNPANLFNIILTATAITSLGFAKANRAAFNKQMSQAKITGGKVTSYGPRTTTPTYLIKGKLRMPAIKYLGRKIPARTVNFRTVQKITRATYKSRAFKVQGATKYMLSKAKFSLKNLKLTKTYVNVDKNVLFKGEGLVKPLGKKFLVKQKIGLKAGLKRVRVKSRGVVGKKKITKLTAKETQTVITRLKKVQSTDKVVRLKFKSEYAQIGSKSIRQAVAESLKGILKNLKKSTTKKSLGIARANIKTLRVFLKDYFKARGSLFKDKKGTLYISRERAPTLGAKPPARDFSVIDNLLKKVEQLDKARKAIVVRKVSLRAKGVAKPKARFTQKLQFRVKYLDPSLIFKGYKLLARPLLLNKFIPISLVLPKELVKAFGVAGVPSLPKVVAKPVAPAKPVARVAAVPGVKPGVGEVTPTPQTVIATIFGSGLLYNRFLPFAGGLPIPGIGGAGRVFSLPLSGLIKGERFKYTADLYSKIYGIKASKSDRVNLLRAGRSFSGLEIRKIV